MKAGCFVSCISTAIFLCRNAILHSASPELEYKQITNVVNQNKGPGPKPKRCGNDLTVNTNAGKPMPVALSRCRCPPMVLVYSSFNNLFPYGIRKVYDTGLYKYTIKTTRVLFMYRKTPQICTFTKICFKFIYMCFKIHLPTVANKPSNISNIMEFAKQRNKQ
jgi:hypothetical protein